MMSRQWRHADNDRATTISDDLLGPRAASRRPAGRGPRSVAVRVVVGAGGLVGGVKSPGGDSRDKLRSDKLTSGVACAANGMAVVRPTKESRGE